VHSCYTQKQCTARGSSWGLPSLLQTIEGSWIHLGGGEGCQTSRQPADASTPYGSWEVHDRDFSTVCNDDLD